MVFFEHYVAHWGLHLFYGVRTRTTKYVRYYGEDDTEELYDLEADPHGLHNRAGDPAYEVLRRKLAAAAPGGARSIVTHRLGSIPHSKSLEMRQSFAAAPGGARSSSCVSTRLRKTLVAVT
jgi:hypothetical protein